MKLWFGKKSSSSEDAVIMKAIPVPEQSSPNNAASTAVSSPTPVPAAPVATPVLPLSARREKQSIPNERRDLYYHLMNSLYDAVLVLDENGHIVDCNERTESVLDFTKEDIWDMAISKVIPAINPQVFNQMKEGLHGQRRVLVNAYCRRKDGSTFPGEVGAGLMTLIGENLVLTIRNIEKRFPAQAIFKSSPPADTSAPVPAGAATPANAATPAPDATPES